jgi:hypothetical protein
VKAGERLGAAQLGDPRARHRRHRPLLADQRAGEPRQHGILGVRVGLLVRSVLDARGVARELEQHVLEAAAGAEDRRIAGARLLDRRQHRVLVAVGRAGHHPQRIERRGAAGLGAVGRHPAGVHAGRHQLERRVQLAMGQIARVAVAEDADAGHQQHPSL